MRRIIYLLFLLPTWGFAQTAPVAASAVLTTPVPTEQFPLTPAAAYPSYHQYVAIMRGLAERYPDRCALENWGTLPSGREILTLRITRDVAMATGRPQVLCTAAMHGNETAGYWLLLRLAEHLLTDDTGGLLAEVDVFINPLANPDGAYRRSDESLLGASRGNRIGVDLNRNYPDPDDGAHPDGYDYQPETEIFMRAAHNHGFDLALNLHGGAEVFNYPWDTYRERHADTNWWRRVSREFAGRAQAASGRSSYFNDRHNGTTNGHDWYPIAGSRQDYMNYYHRCREATIEVSNEKQYPARRLPQLWSSLSPALLGYINEARYGLTGTVVDRQSRSVVAASVEIPNHDAANSSVFADKHYGNFHRYLAGGEYQVLFSAPGYVPQWRSITVKNGVRTEVLVELERLDATGKR